MEITFQIQLFNNQNSPKQQKNLDGVFCTTLTKQFYSYIENVKRDMFKTTLLHKI